jgi:acyl-coenzyme A synthetase/AMP-(fatty) acid ligase
MMILDGIHIFPAEIEALLEAHPAVAQAAALPVRSAAHGEIPVAAVELRPGATATGSDLLAHARARLGLRAPRRVLVLEALPRNPQGKVIRSELAARFAPGGTA